MESRRISTDYILKICICFAKIVFPLIGKTNTNRNDVDITRLPLIGAPCSYVIQNSQTKLFSTVIASVLFLFPLKAIAQNEFDCSPTFYQYFNESLSFLDTTTGIYTKIGELPNMELGAIGYNVQDNLIYGIGRDNNTAQIKFLRFYLDGSIEELGEVARFGLAGDMNRGGKFILLNEYGLFEIETVEPFTITTHYIANFPSDLPGDIAYIPSEDADIFYGLVIINETTYLYAFNLNTTDVTISEVSVLAGSALPKEGGFGSIWTDSDNDLYAYHNNSGKIFLVENYITESPIASSILITQNFAQSDGASCPNAKNPFTSDVGNYVWNDINHNGIQDDFYNSDSENGLEGVKVKLFNYTGEEVDSTVTDNSGSYLFKRLSPGKYKITLDESTLFNSNLPTFDYDGVDTPYQTEFTLSTNSHNKKLDFAFSDIALSIYITDFSVNVVDNVIRLSWATESETQNQGFIIERKLLHENNWKELSNFKENPGLRGQGSITHRTEYEYIDSTALSGFTYEYRLGDVDYNTAKNYHNNITVRIDVAYTAIPEQFLLYPAYPNPFNPITTITYSLPNTSHIKLSIYNINGNLVRKLVNKIENPGKKKIIWDSRNGLGEDVPSGMYIYTLQTGEYKKSKKLLLIR